MNLPIRFYYFSCVTLIAQSQFHLLLAKRLLHWLRMSLACHKESTFATPWVGCAGGKTCAVPLALNPDTMPKEAGKFLLGGTGWGGGEGWTGGSSCNREGRRQDKWCWPMSYPIPLPGLKVDMELLGLAPAQIEAAPLHRLGLYMVKGNKCSITPRRPPTCTFPGLDIAWAMWPPLRHGWLGLGCSLGFLQIFIYIYIGCCW